VEKLKQATLQKKVEQVNEVVEQFQNNQSAIVVNCIGLTVAEVMDLRRQLYAKGTELKVIKNNVLRRAAATVGYVGLDEVLSGPSAVAFSNDAANASKVIYDFAKKNKRLGVKAGVVDGKVMNVEEFKVFATLPNKEGMLSMLLSVLQAPIRNLAYAVKSVAEQNL
jgi:large subunit ribosomal protein L10